MIRPPTGDEAHFRVAGLLRRTVAATVDGLLLAPFLLTAGGAALFAAGQPLPRPGELGLGYLVSLALDGGLAGAAAVVIAALVAGLYLLLFQWLRGQTPGMRLLGLRVIDGHGAPPSLPRALARTLALLLSGLLFSLGFLWIAFDREKRGLHDWLAGTWVVLGSRSEARVQGPLAECSS